MKRLTKIKLINWHGFYDETIDVSGSILFTGDNGSGKSTIIDALYFLLTGGEENKFNTAANESTKRTVETYMRGRVGTEGREFLREESSLISHIALEFYDDLAKRYFVLGVVLEIQESRQKIGKTQLSLLLSKAIIESYLKYILRHYEVFQNHFERTVR